MSPLGRRQPARGERSAAEREAARRDREARRASREGRPPPVQDTPPGPGDADSATDEAPGEPQPADVAPAAEPPAAGGHPVWEEPPVAEPSQVAEPPAQAEEPPATARAWARAAGAPDPDPPRVRRVAPGEAPPAPAAGDDPPPAPALGPAPPSRIPAAPPLPFGTGEDRPLGTRRVSALHRRDRGDRGAPPPPAPPRSTADGDGPGRRRRRPATRAALAVILVVVAAAAWLAISLYEPFKGDAGAVVPVTIPKGATPGDVGDLLARRGVVGSSFFFGLRTRIEGKRGDFKAGTFRLRKDMSYAAAIDALTHNPPAPKVIRVTIPEGRSRSEIAPIARQAGLKGSYVDASKRSAALKPRRYGAPKGTSSLEGFLFPATYELKPGAKASALVADQLEAFRTNIGKVDLRRAKRKNLTTYDVLIIASMVEREAGVAKDRPLIAAVIYNRLKDGMPLGIDATLRFALHDWDRPLRVSELNRDTPYNTRKHTGLPPTPIGNPGLDSIKAAAHPASVDYLYYVIKPCGNGAHAFSSTDAQFQRDVQAYNRARAKRGGKSPVNCK